MRILFLHQHFHPETVGTSTRAVEIVEWLASRGHRVTVVAGIPSHPSTMASGETPRRQPRHETFRGADLHRVWTFGTSRPDTFFRRMLAYGSFMVLGGLKALFVKDSAGPFDAMVAISPLPNGVAGAVVSRLRGIPLMFDVCDIWPDCAVAVDMLKPEGPLTRVAQWLEKRVYAAARRIGVVTPGFTGNLTAKGVPEAKVRLLPDWVDPAVYDPAAQDPEAVRAELGLDGKFVVSFLGNFGLLMGLDAILDTAKLVKDRDLDVLFLFVGKGVELPMMERRVADEGLTNVRIMPYQPREKVPGLLAASDALIVTYKRTPITLITVPSKIYEYMSMARPVVAGVEGVVGGILREAECGLVSETRDPAQLADFVMALKNDPAGAATMGAAGRARATARYSFARVASDYELAILETAVGGGE